MYTLPAVLQTSRAFTAVMAAAEIALVTIFSNTRDIIASPALLKRFLELPQPALLALLRSSKFATDAEASVLLLVSTWSTYDGNDGCSEEGVTALNNEIRYSRLSRPYLTDLCDCLSLHDLTRTELRELWAYSSLSAENRKDWTKHPKLNPVQWYLPARPRVTSVNAVAAKLMLDVTEANLKHLLSRNGIEGDEISFQTPAVHAEGFVWTLELSIDTTGAFWCAVYVKALYDAQDITAEGQVDVDHGVACFSSIHIMGQEPLQLYLAKRSLVTSTGSGRRLGGKVGTFKDAAALEWWTKYIVNGRVRFIATIKSVLNC